MFNFVYSWMLNGKSRDYKMCIEEAIDVINNYDLWSVLNDVVTSGSGEFSRDGHIVNFSANFYFRTNREDKTLVDLYYGNLHIHASISEAEKIYSVRIKNRNEDWQIDVDKGPSHPCNETYEVYVGYLIPILDVSEVDEFRYNHGKWDKYVYITMSDFFEEINKHTIVRRLNDTYKNYKKEKYNENV